MDTKKNELSRRQFIKDTSTALIGGSLLLGSSDKLLATADQATKSSVVLIRNKQVMGEDGMPKQPIVEEMLDQALSKLTGKTDPLAAWKSIIKPEDIVGIKSNVWSPIGTTKEVEGAIKNKVIASGVPNKNIGIADRQLYRNPIFQKASALINARPMRFHHWSGVGSLIKNYITFIHDPYNYHEDACARLGEIWNSQRVKEKTRLNILVMLTPQFHGVGPHSFSPRYVWNYNGLIVGFDPVAVDTIGVNIFQAKRKEYFGEDRPLNPLPTHIKVADKKYGLGNSDMNKIKLIKMGDMTDILV